MFLFSVYVINESSCEGSLSTDADWQQIILFKTQYYNICVNVPLNQPTEVITS